MPRAPCATEGADLVVALAIRAWDPRLTRPAWRTRSTRWRGGPASTRSSRATPIKPFPEPGNDPPDGRLHGVPVRAAGRPWWLGSQ